MFVYKRRMKLTIKQECSLFKSCFSVINDKNRHKKNTNLHSARSIPCSCCGLEVFNCSGKEKACIAGRNCSAGISVVELPRLLVWEHVRLRSLRPAASPTQQQNNGTQNNPKVISSSCIHKTTQVAMSTMSFTNLQPPIQSKPLFIQACCLPDVSLWTSFCTMY